MKRRNPESGFIELLFEPWAWAIIGVVLVVCALVYPFLTSVDQGEIVIKDCGDRDVTVWRSPADDGVHWDGFCRTETYYGSDTRSFKEPIVVDGVHYTVRGTATFGVSHLLDRQIVELHRRYGSADALYQAIVLSPIHLALSEAVADPAWAQPQGGFVERKLKGVLEYGLKRISPTGHIWTAPETRQALEKRLNQRLTELGTLPTTVTLGFVTER